MKKTRIFSSILVTFIFVAISSASIFLFIQNNKLRGSLRQSEFGVEVLTGENRSLGDKNEALIRELASKTEVYKNILHDDAEIKKKLTSSEEKLLKLEEDLKNASKENGRLNKEIERLNSEISTLKSKEGPELPKESLEAPKESSGQAPLTQ
jgi:peptidoglycan hydrolase CwlO-like protein